MILLGVEKICDLRGCQEAEWNDREDEDAFAFENYLHGS